MVFLGGMCVHPGGFVMAFQHAAAAHGDLVGVQGDIECGRGTGFRRFSSDVEALDRRIDAAFRAAGRGGAELRGVVVIGNSQGAERGEKLVARWPDKYSSAILIGSPVKPSPTLLRRANVVATMSGEHDVAFGKMRAASIELERAGVRSSFFAIRGARHGSLGEHPELAMLAAIQFVASGGRVPEPAWR
jgi:pimeloyl-ACP methyl ester carboxylesterase